jgi:hypothetical protein
MDTKELWEFVKNDIRTPSEIFEELRQQVQEMSGGKLSEKESIEATRNLIGFCETVMGLGKNNRKRLDVTGGRSTMENEVESGFVA